MKQGIDRSWATRAWWIGAGPRAPGGEDRFLLGEELEELPGGEDGRGGSIPVGEELPGGEDGRGGSIPVGDDGRIEIGIQNFDRGIDVFLLLFHLVGKRPRRLTFLHGGSIQYCPLLASCDGLLLLGVGGIEPEQYLICNPTTRQWSDLPRPSGYAGQEEHRESGFYFHEPSGEHRVLYYVSERRSTTAYYCVLSAGADVPRRLGVQATPIEHTVAVASHGGHEFGSLHNLMTPAVLHGHLHWLQHMEAGLSGQMVAFDTVAETFRRMPPPPVTQKKNSNLLAADGSLMACEPGHLFIDLWALDGYAGAAATGKERWERRHRIEVPWKAYRLVLAAGDDEGHVVVGMQRGVVAYNVRSGTVRLVAGVGASGGGQAVDPSRHVLRESLVRHGFFERRPHPGLPFFSFCT
jgi:hypothetical protein